VNILAQVNFITFLFCLFIIFYIIYKDPKGKLNRLCVLLFLSFAIWSFGFYARFLSVSYETALFWINFAAPGWVGFPVASLYYCLALSGRNILIKNRLLLFFLLAVVGFFLYQQWTNNLVVRLVMMDFGWAGVWTSSLVAYSYYAYVGILCLASIFLLYNLGKKQKASTEHRQFKVLSWTAIISLVLGTLTNIVFSVESPPLANIIVSFLWGSGVLLSMTRYGLMSITPLKATNQILNTMNDSLLLLDAAGTVRFANRATLEMLDYRGTDLKGIDFRYFCAETKRADELLDGTLREGASINFDLMYCSRQGKEIPVQISASRVRDKNQQVLGFVIVARDITERKQMEKQIIDLYEKEKAQRRELQEEARARDMFVDILGHELRTPLTPILTSSELLEEILAVRPEGIEKRLTANIRDGAVTLASRLEELLDLARYSRGTFKIQVRPTNLNHLIPQIVSRFTPALDKLGQTLTLEIPPDLPEACIDPSRLEQVLVNLLSNASKYSREKSIIGLTVKMQSGELNIAVKDDGIGICAEDQTDLFKPYHRIPQGRRKIPGLGLGLAVCKQIVDAHKGRIWIESQPGKGSTFMVAIPQGCSIPDNEKH